MTEAKFEDAGMKTLRERHDEKIEIKTTANPCIEYNVVQATEGTRGASYHPRICITLVPSFARLFSYHGMPKEIEDRRAAGDYGEHDVVGRGYARGEKGVTKNEWESLTNSVETLFDTIQLHIEPHAMRLYNEALEEAEL